MDWNTVARHIDYGKLQAALNVGQPYSVYRLGANAAAAFVDPLNLKYSNFRMLRRINTKRENYEGPEHFGTLVYEFIGDATNLFVGDVLLQADPFWGIGDTLVDFFTIQYEGVCLVAHQPEKKTMAARLDRFGAIYRVQSTPDATGFWDGTLNFAQPLVLTNGVYSFGTVGQTPTPVPLGLQSISRTFEDLVKGLPTTTKRTHWECYIPPLPGVHLQESDRILMDANPLLPSTCSRYTIHHPFNQEAGFVGYQLVLSRDIQPAA